MRASLVLAAFAVCASQAIAEPPVSKTPLQLYIQDALNQSFAELGLGAREKKLLETEVAAESAAFVTNYRQTGEGGTDVRRHPLRLPPQIPRPARNFA